MVYTTPANGYTNSLIREITNGNHTLIAGKTGSGKSVLLNDIIMEILFTKFPICNTSNHANEAGLILIDPKMVELSCYKNVPHVMAYADNAQDALSALEYADEIMMNRYTELSAKGLRKWDGQDIYIIIDEFADFTGNKAIASVVDRIARLGRASKVHLIIATQRPSITDRTLSAATRANLDTRIALRVAEAKDSRMIIGKKGAEDLPMYGFCLIDTPSLGSIQQARVMLTPDNEIDRVIKWWESQKPQTQTRTKPKSIWDRLFA